MLSHVSNRSFQTGWALTCDPARSQPMYNNQVAVQWHCGAAHPSLCADAPCSASQYHHYQPHGSNRKNRENVKLHKEVTELQQSDCISLKTKYFQIGFFQRHWNSCTVQTKRHIQHTVCTTLVIKTHSELRMPSTGRSCHEGNKKRQFDAIFHSKKAKRSDTHTHYYRK